MVTGAESFQETAILAFDMERDFDSILRMWAEVGWWDGEARQKAAIRKFFEANDGRSVVGHLGGAAECVAHRTLGVMRYDTTDLSLGALTGVTTSRVARKLGLASHLTARTVALLADEGAAVAMLGMFDQGFYDRFGFGTLSYVHTAHVSPGNLLVPAPYRTPERFDPIADAEELHAAIANRHRDHGGVVIGGERMTSVHFEIDSTVTIFGYRTDGVISHFMAVQLEGEHGPDKVESWAFETPEQCLELLRLIQEWGDQLDLIQLHEPPWQQIQDFMVQPGRDLRRKPLTEASVRIEADAWWQARILDLNKCVQAVTAELQEAAVVVELTDPVVDHLPDGGDLSTWDGVNGRWRIAFGPDGGAQRAPDAQADLACSINAFSRWWFGVVPARTLLAAGQFQCEESVAVDLDRLTAHLPRTHPGWDF